MLGLGGFDYYVLVGISWFSRVLSGLVKCSGLELVGISRVWRGLVGIGIVFLLSLLELCRTHHKGLYGLEGIYQRRLQRKKVLFQESLGLMFKA